MEYPGLACYKIIAKPIAGSYEHSVVADQNCSKLTLDVLSLGKIVFLHRCYKIIAKPIAGSYEHSVVADKNYRKFTLDVLSLENTVFFGTGATKS